MKYQENKQKKWIVTVVVAIIFGIATYFATMFTYGIIKASFDRTPLNQVLNKKLSRFKVSDVATSEMMIISYAYDDQEPRFYSKYFAKDNPYIYNPQVDEAVNGATSMLMYFDPYILPLGPTKTQLLVDGAIIADNPAMYSTYFATELYQKQFVRVVSIGSGISNFKGIEFTSGTFI